MRKNYKSRTRCFLSNLLGFFRERGSFFCIRNFFSSGNYHVTLFREDETRYSAIFPLLIILIRLCGYSGKHSRGAHFSLMNPSRFVRYRLLFKIRLRPFNPLFLHLPQRKQGVLRWITSPLVFYVMYRRQARAANLEKQLRGGGESALDRGIGRTD